MLADEWADFERRILKGAPAIQIREMRRAFYSGAQTLFKLTTEGMDPVSDPTELDLAYMSALNAELQQFARDLGRGRA